MGDAEVIEALVALYDAAELAYDRGSVRPLRDALNAVDEAMFRAHGRVRRPDERSPYVTRPQCFEATLRAVREAASR